MTQSQIGSQTPDDIRHLNQAEHLVIFGFRAVALGYADCPAVLRTFRGMLGAEGDAALSHLFVFARLVGAGARRRLSLHAPGCCRLGQDEQRVLAAVVAAQGSLAGRGDAGLTACLAHLTAQAPDPALVIAAQCFAAALTLAGADLGAGARPPAATVH